MADYNLEGQYWASHTITWSFATSNFAGQPGAFSSFLVPGAYEDAIIAALARWSAVADITFVQVADSASAGIRFGYGTFDGPYGTLGDTGYYYDPRTHYFQPDVTVRFDQAEIYSQSASGLALNGGVTFQSVAMHEIGHALGLDHYDATPAIMGTYASAGVRDLTASDIHGITALYGVHPASLAKPIIAAIGDFNSDSVSDILLRESSGRVSELFVNGNVSTNQQLGGASAATQIVGTGHFHSTTASDVLLRDTTTGSVSYWSVDNGQYTASTQIGGMGANMKILGTGDFNHDNFSDLLLLDSSTGAISEWATQSGQYAGSTQLGGIGSNIQFSGIGDFNHDATSDVLFRDATTGAVSVWSVDNFHFVQSQQIGGIGSNIQIAGTGDFNGDATADILLRDLSTGAVSVWNVLNGQFSASHQIGGLPSSVKIAGVGDFNGDHTSDILLQDASGATSVWSVANNNLQSSTGFDLV